MLALSKGHIFDKIAPFLAAAGITVVRFLPLRSRAITFLPRNFTQKKYSCRATAVLQFYPYLFAMLLIPAIDLKDGQCVRLKQGDMQQTTVFSTAPAEMARYWVNQGARRLHLVDLNGAAVGKPKNDAAIRAIIDEVGEEVPIQLGGWNS